MRTTVTLDSDVAARLKQVTRERGVPFKTAINDALRAGLGSDAGVVARRYRERTAALGVRPAFDLTKALAQADALEDEETVRQLDMRK